MYLPTASGIYASAVSIVKSSFSLHEKKLIAMNAKRLRRNID